MMMKKLYSFALISGIALTLAACVAPPYGGGGHFGGGNGRPYYNEPQRAKRPPVAPGQRRPEARQDNRIKPQQPNRPGDMRQRQPQRQPPGDNRVQRPQPKGGEPNKGSGGPAPKKPQGKQPDPRQPKR